MPLVSARNPDVLDVANFEDDANSSSLLKRSSLTLAYTPEDVVSVMTMHSAFQSPNGNDASNSPGKLKNATNNLNSFFRRNRQSTSRIEEHVNIASDDFSVNSLPIQNCDVASVEEMWMKEQQTFVEPTPKMKRKKFSTQTYSDRGTVHSSLRTQMTSFNSDNQSVATKSVATATLGENSYIQNAYKSRGSARLLSEIVQVHVTNKYNKSQDESALEEKEAANKARKNSQPPRPKPSRSYSSRSSVSSTKDETGSVCSQRTTSSSNHTSETKLERDMYRLSLELANTLATLDTSNSQVARFRKQVEELQVAVQTLQTEKEALNERLESYEQKKTLMTEPKPEIKVERNKERRVVEPACVTPSRDADRWNVESRPFFSPGANSSFSDPGVYSRDESGLLFPDLNESHISCPDLYASRVHDEFGTTIEEEDEDIDVYSKEQNEQNTSVELIDPRDEVFDDDPFATCFNYSIDSSVNNSVEGGNYNAVDDDDGDSVYSKAFSIAQSVQGAVNTTSLTTATALTQLSKKLPMFRKKAKDVLNTSIESQLSHMKNMANVAPSKREKSILNQSNSTMNISKLFKFGNGNGNDDDISVSIRSQVSRPSFFNFGR